MKTKSAGVKCLNPDVVMASQFPHPLKNNGTIFFPLIFKTAERTRDFNEASSDGSCYKDGLTVEAMQHFKDSPNFSQGLATSYMQCYATP